MSKEEVVLQLTLKSMDRMFSPKAGDYSNTEQFNNQLSTHVFTIYNNIYDNLKYRT